MSITREIAPIVMFVYNRPWHTKQTLMSLKHNYLASQSQLFIYADGAKSSDNEQVEAVRKIIREEKWCKSVEIIESNENKGLADSITYGVTETLKLYDKVIVLEDDLITAKGFLQYMNEALNLYEDTDKAVHISGYFQPIPRYIKFPTTFFYRVPSCWGWATWKDKWKLFNADAEYLYEQLAQRNLLYAFDLEGSNALLNQLINNIKGVQKTWFIKWYASIFLENGLCLHPGKSLVRNIGHDGTGSNCGNSSGTYMKQSINNKVKVKKIPIVENKKAVKYVNKFYTEGISLTEMMRSYLRGFIGKSSIIK